MKNSILLILISLAMFLGSCKQNYKENATSIPSDSLFKSFDSQINALCGNLNIKSFSYAIVNDNRILFSKSFGEKQNGQSGEVDENTLFPIGNLAEIMASVIILQQIEAKKIELKTKLSEYGMYDPKVNKTTIKQLLSLTYLNKPGTCYEYDPVRLEIEKKIIETALGQSFSEALENEIFEEFEMENSKATEKGVIESSVADLANFSMALDKNKLFNDSATTDLMYRPVYLANGELAPTSLGWFVQFYDDKKFAWSFGYGENYSSLILKSLSTNLTFIVLANSENLNKPFNLYEGNFINSPIATAFLKTLILQKDTLPSCSINQPDSITNNAFQNIAKSKHRSLLLNELVSNITMFQYMNNNAEKNRLITLYNKYLPNDIPFSLLEKNPLALIKNVGDYAIIKRKFHIEKDTLVTIYAVGEFIKELATDPWQYDNVELFLDVHNNKKTTFDNKVHRHYRVTYDYPILTGNYSTDDNIEFVQSDPTKSKYCIEMMIPWKTLDNIIPANGIKLGFDLSIGDNDGNLRESIINWHFEKSQKPWENPSVLGTMILSDKTINNRIDSICTSIKSSSPINIDGKVDAAWNAAPSYKFSKFALDKMPDSKDLSGTFRTLWDNKNLYVLVEVSDDIKILLPSSGDFGWIENEKNDTIWSMTPANTKHAGGAKSNRFIYTTLKLKKGDYILNYSSNQTNSSVRWINKQPDMNFYGIAVY